MSGWRGNPAIDDQEIAIEDSGIAHGFSRCAHEERSCWSAHEMLIEVELALDMVIRRARESGWHVSAEQRELEFIPRLSD